MNGVSPPLVLMNPRARQASRVSWEPLRRALTAAWAPRFVQTRDTAHATALVRDAVDQGCPVVGVAGGDGTINVALNALAGRDVPLAVIPLGTANDLANGLPSARVEREPETGPWKRIDVLEVNGRRFCTTGGLGIPSQVVERSEALRGASGAYGIAHGLLGLLGASLYSLVAAEHALRGRARPERRVLSWLAPGATRREERELDGVGLFISNQPRLGGALCVCPSARHDDGVFEIGVLLARSPAEIFALLAACGSGRPSRHLEVLRATEAEIACEAPGWFFGDGELLCNDRRFAVTIRPGAARVARPSAPGAVAARARATAPW